MSFSIESATTLATMVTDTSTRLYREDWRVRVATLGVFLSVIFLVSGFVSLGGFAVGDPLVACETELDCYNSGIPYCECNGSEEGYCVVGDDWWVVDYRCDSGVNGDDPTGTYCIPGKTASSSENYMCTLGESVYIPTLSIDGVILPFDAVGHLSMNNNFMNLSITDIDSDLENVDVSVSGCSGDVSKPVLSVSGDGYADYGFWFNTTDVTQDSCTLTLNVSDISGSWAVYNPYFIIDTEAPKVSFLGGGYYLPINGYLDENTFRTYTFMVSDYSEIGDVSIFLSDCSGTVDELISTYDGLYFKDYKFKFDTRTVTESYCMFSINASDSVGNWEVYSKNFTIDYDEPNMSTDFNFNTPVRSNGIPFSVDVSISDNTSGIDHGDIIVSSDIVRYTEEFRYGTDYKVNYCNPNSISPSTGELDCSSVNDVTHLLNKETTAGVTISDAAPSMVLMADFENVYNSRIVLNGRSAAAYTQDEFCLLIRADDDGDMIYETEIYNECRYDVEPYSRLDFSFENSGYQSLLIYPSTGVMVVDFIGDTGNVGAGIRRNLTFDGFYEFGNDTNRGIVNSIKSYKDPGVIYVPGTYRNTYRNDTRINEYMYARFIESSGEFVQDGLIGHWSFDGNGDNEFLWGSDADLVGDAVFNPDGGKLGGYAYVPTGSDYVKIPYDSAFDLSGEFTVEFWFRQRSNQSFMQNLVYKGSPANDYNFYIFRKLWNEYNNGLVTVGHTAANTGYWTQPSTYNDLAHGEWHHVVYVKDTDVHAYYLDGVLMGSKDVDIYIEYSGPAKTPAVDIIIGDSAVDTDFDELMIYDRALSYGEILSNDAVANGVSIDGYIFDKVYYDTGASNSLQLSDGISSFSPYTGYEENTSYEFIIPSGSPLIDQLTLTKVEAPKGVYNVQVSAYDMTGKSTADVRSAVVSNVPLSVDVNIDDEEVVREEYEIGVEVTTDLNLENVEIGLYCENDLADPELTVDLEFSNYTEGYTTYFSAPFDSTGVLDGLCTLFVDVNDEFDNVYEGVSFLVDNEPVAVYKYSPFYNNYFSVDGGNFSVVFLDESPLNNSTVLVGVGDNVYGLGDEELTFTWWTDHYFGGDSSSNNMADVSVPVNMSGMAHGENFTIWAYIEDMDGYGANHTFDLTADLVSPTMDISNTETVISGTGFNFSADLYDEFELEYSFFLILDPSNRTLYTGSVKNLTDSYFDWNGMTSSLFGNGLYDDVLVYGMYYGFDDPTTVPGPLDDDQSPVIYPEDNIYLVNGEYDRDGLDEEYEPANITLMFNYSTGDLIGMPPWLCIEDFDCEIDFVIEDGNSTFRPLVIYVNRFSDLMTPFAVYGFGKTFTLTNDTETTLKVMRRPAPLGRYRFVAETSDVAGNLDSSSFWFDVVRADVSKHRMIDALEFLKHIPLRIDMGSDLSMDFNISLNADFSNVTFSASRYGSNPVNSTLTNGFSFTEIESSGSDVLDWFYFRFYYEESDISGLDESTLRIYYYNETSGSWETQPGGVNIIDNYVWANVTHMSLFSFAGDTVTTTTTVPPSDPPSSPGGTSDPTTTTASTTTTTLDDIATTTTIVDEPVDNLGDDLVADTGSDLESDSNPSGPTGFFGLGESTVGIGVVFVLLALYGGFKMGLFKKLSGPRKYWK